MQRIMMQKVVLIALFLFMHRSFQKEVNLFFMRNPIYLIKSSNMG